MDSKPPDSDRDGPERRVMALRVKLTQNLLAIWNMLSVARFGGILTLLAGDKDMHERIVRFCRTIDLQPAHLLSNPEAGLRTMSPAAAKNALRGAEAAAIVFAHAMAEELLMELSRILVDIDPKPWLRFIQDRELTVREFVEKPQEQVIAEKLQVFLQDMDKYSMPKKTDVLFSVLQPENAKEILPGFTFSKKTLAEIDELRHRCAHDEIKDEIPDLQAKIKFIENMVDFFIKAAEAKHNLRLPNSEQDPDSLDSSKAAEGLTDP